MSILFLKKQKQYSTVHSVQYSTEYDACPVPTLCPERSISGFKLEHVACSCNCDFVWFLPHYGATTNTLWGFSGPHSIFVVFIIRKHSNTAKIGALLYWLLSEHQDVFMQNFSIPGCLRAFIHQKKNLCHKGHKVSKMVHRLPPDVTNPSCLQLW